jgi:hypothetical protein
VPAAQSSAEIAEVIAHLIDHPCAEVYTNPDVQANQVIRYYSDVAAFEESLINKYLSENYI